MIQYAVVAIKDENGRWNEVYETTDHYSTGFVYSMSEVKAQEACERHGWDFCEVMIAACTIELGGYPVKLNTNVYYSFKYEYTREKTEEDEE